MSKSTRSFKITDRDRVALKMAECYISTLSEDLEEVTPGWLESQEGAAEVAAAAYRLADALIHESGKTPNPPLKEGLKSV